MGGCEELVTCLAGYLPCCGFKECTLVQNMAAPPQRSSVVKEDVSRVLVLSRVELQQLNLDRLFSELEQKDILSKGITNVLKQKSAAEKCNVLMTVLESRDFQDFDTLLEIVCNENNTKFRESTQNFLEMVRIRYPWYKDYYHLLESRVGVDAKEGKIKTL